MTQAFTPSLTGSRVPADGSLEPPSPRPARASPWAQTADDVAAQLSVDVGSGLASAVAARRLRSVGPNVLRAIKQRSLVAVLIDQLRSVLVGLLAVASIVAAAFGEWVEAGAILAVLVINTVVGFMTERAALRSMDALRALGVTHVAVRRDGKTTILAAQNLVPGDVVVVEGGDVVTADLRLVEASKLQADEATLTGESLSATKSVGMVAREASLGARTCMLFKGTVVTRGSGVGIVVATGMQSELGKISSLVEEATQERTPLEQRLNRLGQGLLWVTLVVTALIVVLGVLTGQSLLVAVETGIALAVATVPEGLPVIATIALARGMHRMARRNALINRLSAVETLGATSVICTDKTGTLTENRLAVAQLLLADVPDARRRALEIGALCNNAELGSEEASVGEPLEVALLRAAAKEGVHRAALLKRWPELREVAFDPETRLMATVHGTGPYRVVVKGAPEAVLERCTLDSAQRSHWLAQSDQLAATGLRVLALAERTTDDPPGKVYEALSFIGLVGMHDPPRANVHATIAACRRAGVRLVMVTGDHPETAANIAEATGLVQREASHVLLGARLDHPASLSDHDRDELVAAQVFARVSPEQKLNLIALHQAQGAVVAMTGDGVNDAPALRKADIGIAMGKRGTAAAREAADMVLKDDDFSTIVPALIEGRVIFDNIRTFVLYLLSCNLSEIFVVAIAAVVGLPLPLLPLQILFLNLVTDVFPALALGVGGGAEGIDRRPPRNVAEPLLTHAHWRAIVSYGIAMGTSVLAVYALASWVLGLSPELCVTVSFLSLAFAQLWHVFNMRSADSGVIRNAITRNTWVWAALGLCVALIIAALYIPPLADVLGLTPPNATAWLLVALGSFAPLVGAQLFKLARR